MHEAREHVAAHRIGAEDEIPIAVRGPDWRQAGEAAILFERIVRRQETGEDGEEDDGRHDGEPHDGAAVLAEGAPEGDKRVGRCRLDGDCGVSGHGGCAD
jgi:hypothetical protein